MYAMIIDPFGDCVVWCDCLALQWTQPNTWAGLEKSTECACVISTYICAFSAVYMDTFTAHAINLQSSRNEE